MQPARGSPHIRNCPQPLSPRRQEPLSGRDVSPLSRRHAPLYRYVEREVGTFESSRAATIEAQRERAAGRQPDDDAVAGLSAPRFASISPSAECGGKAVRGLSDGTCFPLVEEGGLADPHRVQSVRRRGVELLPIMDRLPRRAPARSSARSCARVAGGEWPSMRIGRGWRDRRRYCAPSSRTAPSISSVSRPTSRLRRRETRPVAATSEPDEIGFDLATSRASPTSSGVTVPSVSWPTMMKPFSARSTCIASVP